MSILRIEKILNAHSVPCYIQGDRIFADGMCAFADLYEETIDMTDISYEDLMVWLGY